MSYRRKIGLFATSLIVAASLLPGAADAQRDRRGTYSQRGDFYDRGGRQNYDRPRDRADDRGGRGDRGRNQRCDRGTGGTLLGAIAGGLLGNAAVDRRGDRAIDRDC